MPRATDRYIRLVSTDLIFQFKCPQVGHYHHIELQALCLVDMGEMYLKSTRQIFTS